MGRVVWWSAAGVGIGFSATPVAIGAVVALGIAAGIGYLIGSSTSEEAKKA